MSEDESDKHSDAVREQSAEDAVREQSAEDATFSKAQIARIERNRQRALMLRQSRLATHPYATDALGNRVKGPARQVDTGAGFFIDEGEEQERVETKVVHPEGPVMEGDLLLCVDCGKEFMESFYQDKFEESVCDTCRKNNEKHKLITKTEARNKYMLKDVDLEKREPTLKFIVRKNPRDPRWGDMKLYLESQVSKRALEVWGSEEKIEDARHERTENRNRSKQKQYDKKVKDLRLAVRSSLVRKETGTHQHEFGTETYDEEEDIYSKQCLTCKHTMTYEKM